MSNKELSHVICSIQHKARVEHNSKLRVRYSHISARAALKAQRRALKRAGYVVEQIFVENRADENILPAEIFLANPKRCFS